MTERAQRFIAEAMKSRATELDLSHCELTEIPAAIGEMVWLEGLNLSGNQIEQIQGLDALINLQRLDLYRNQLRQIEGLDALVNLQELDLGSNQLTQIEGLDALVNLQTLYLFSNQLTQIEGLDALENLQGLDLGRNQLRQIEGLDALGNLEALSLSRNQLRQIEGLDALGNLESLYLHWNQLASLSPLRFSHFPQLRLLNLSHNPLPHLPDDEGLRQLDVLGLSGLPLEQLPPCLHAETPCQPFIWKEIDWENAYPSNIDFPRRAGYTYLKIRHDLVAEFPKGIYLEDCHNLKKPAPEWIQLGPELVQAYFKAIAEQGEEEMNEVKVLLVGDGGAGKTSLAYRLAKPKEDLPKEEGRTRGIDIYDWSYQREKKKHTVHLWDFGGQVMYDMVHQYFYSQRALYILMDSSRSGASEYDSRLNQLLQSAELFGRNSQMLMIQNEHTGHQKQMDFSVLKKNYPFLTEFHSVNLKSTDGLKEIKEVIKKHIAKIPGMGVVMPKRWMKVRKRIQKLVEKKSTIYVSEFRDICVKQGITDEAAQDTLSRYFHQLGVFLHFQDNPNSSLARLIILNREWATKASYKVFDTQLVKEAQPQGSFRADQLADIWPEAEFRDFRPELLQLMQQFEICYELKSNDTYLVPRMMTKMPEEDFCAGEERPLTFYYEYTFMPEGLVNRLSVRLHEMIGGAQGDRVWSDGVVFEAKGLKAEVRELRQPDKDRIQLRIIGTSSDWMSETLIREIDKINENFNLERLKVSTLIPCNCAGCQTSDDPYYLDFHQVKKDLQNPDPAFHSFLCQKTRKKIDYHALLKTISHKAVEEAEEIQRREKIGRFAGRDEVSFKGERAVGIAETLMNSKELIETEGEKTRQHVSTEADHTRQQVLKRLDEIPPVLRKNIAEDQKEQFAQVLAKIEEVEFEVTHAQDLIELVGMGIDEAFRKQPSQQELLIAFQQAMMAQNDSKSKLSEKLKVSLWLIPTLLKYEADVSLDLRTKMKEVWRKAGLGNMVL